MTTAQSIDKQIDYLDQRLTEMEGIMINPQEFGELKAEVTAQRRDLDKIVSSIENLARQVELVKDTLTEARGGWKTMMFVGTAFASVGGAITWALSHVKVI